MLFVCLVNNVGYFKGYPGYFGEVSEEVSCDFVNKLMQLCLVVTGMVFCSGALQNRSDQLSPSSTGEVCVGRVTYMMHNTPPFSSLPSLLPPSSLPSSLLPLTDDSYAAAKDGC